MTSDAIAFTELELAILSWVAEKTIDRALRVQLQGAKPLVREFSGAGSFTDLAVPKESPHVDPTHLPYDGEGPLSGPEITGPDFEYPACSLIFFKNGRAVMLEIAGPREVGYSHPLAFTLIGEVSDRDDG